MKYATIVDCRFSKRKSDSDEEVYHCIFDMESINRVSDNFFHSYRASYGMYRSGNLPVYNHTEFYSCVFWDW